jgi:hypothetical protein
MDSICERRESDKMPFFLKQLKENAVNDRSKLGVSIFFHSQNGKT